MIKAHLYVAPAALVAGYKGALVWWQHAFASPDWMNRVVQRCPADAIACSSEAVAISQRLATPRTRVFMVHPGIDTRRFAPRAAPQHNGSRRAPFVVTTVGRLQPWKNQHEVLRGVAMTIRRGLDVECRIIGGDAWGLSPRYESHLHQLAHELGIADRVTFAGHVDDVRSHLHASSLVVNASAREPFGIVLLEAMAAGVPVAAVASAGPAEIIEHEKTGLLMRDAAPETIADTITRLATDQKLATRLGEAATVAASARTERAMTAEIASELRRTLWVTCR
jgi:glycosyltransferase involved in cell wall biosynthesis